MLYDIMAPIKQYRMALCYPWINSSINSSSESSSITAIMQVLCHTVGTLFVCFDSKDNTAAQGDALVVFAWWQSMLVLGVENFGQGTPRVYTTDEYIYFFGHSQLWVNIAAIGHFTK